MVGCANGFQRLGGQASGRKLILGQSYEINRVVQPSILEPVWNVSQVFRMDFYLGVRGDLLKLADKNRHCQLFVRTGHGYVKDPVHLFG